MRWRRWNQGLTIDPGRPFAVRPAPGPMAQQEDLAAVSSRHDL